MRMKSKKHCTAGCKTGGHKSWGECLRSKALQISPHINDTYSTRQNALNKELDGFESATRQGVMPENTTREAVSRAMKEAESA